jgi:uncharacterized protein
MRPSALLPGMFALFTGMAPAADPAPQAGAKLNALAKEVSPYLRQHAKNPVKWMPWGPEALARAKKENKLIFLSIGYSACHWCHVMEREAFSNLDVAKTLNEHFICIKVDREERPDIDEVYLSALQASGQRGGWPLSMFLTPDAKPIFGGTYFPIEDRKADDETVPGFKSILKRVLELLESDRKGLYEQADRLAEVTVDSIERSFRMVPLLKMDQDLITDATIAYEFDPEYGGFARKANGYRGSKFPRATALLFLLTQSTRPGQEKLAKNLRITLDNLAAGGIYDHLGGGFHRYSTERTWTVPHFEKMLYDNAQLVELFTEAYAQKPNDADARVIRETLQFIEREMTSAEGVFYSALDADTNHKEGEFYVWRQAELAKLGNTPEVQLFKKVYSLEKPNFEEQQHILRYSASWLELVQQSKASEQELLAKLKPIKQQLFELRSKRERPFLDTKILTGWNGLMIGAYARAGQVLKEPKYTQTAIKAAEFVLKNLRQADGRLYRMYAQAPGEKPIARGNAFLEDYAYLSHGLLQLHDATNDAKWLKEARDLTDTMLKWYRDEDRGGMFTTANDAEKLFARGKEYYDGAYPSGNGMAARNLARLYLKTKEKSYAAHSEKIIKQFLTILKTNASATPSLAMALSDLVK